MKVKTGMEKAYAKYAKVNSEDPYSHRCVTYGEEWAALMEARLAKGESIDQCAKATSHEADTDGITGFMYNCAVKALARFWEHGEALRKWHNLDAQLGNEGEKANEKGTVLNTAILHIG